MNIFLIHSVKPNMKCILLLLKNLVDYGMLVTILEILNPQEKEKQEE